LTRFSRTQLGAPYDVSAPAISRHLGVLERCGLIVRWKVGRVHYCRLTAAPLADAASWIERHRDFWNRQLDALGDYLEKEDDRCAPSRQEDKPERDPPA
jgi:DNA-binding transcriptional ArsR family regulator